MCLRLERRVAGFVARHDVLRSGDGVLLLLSGGADSTALLAMLPAVARRLDQGLRLAAVHVDYRARGAASDRDRGIVERACAAAGVPLDVLRLPERLRGAHFQARAREIRYGHAREVAARNGLTVIATAHNRDDQAETVLYRLSKYASPRGLAGMRPRDGDLARPLLCLGADQIRSYCRARALEYGEDESNASQVYARNLLRHDVLPRLQALNPRLSDTLAASALQAAAEADVLAAAVAAATGRVAAAAPPAGAHTALDVSALAAEPSALRALLLHAQVREAMGGEALVQRRLVDALLGLAERPGDGGRVSLGRGLEAAREGGLLVIRGAAPPHSCPPVTLSGDDLPPAGGAPVALAFCGRACEVRLVTGEALDLAAARRGDAVVGLPAPPGRVTLRHPRRGERFAPLGLGAETTVARFLAARRVPPERRRRVLVVEVDGHAAWLGFTDADGARHGRVAHAFRVDESSRCTALVTMEEV
jgi:tRNA(Ile)-lysidine synthase